MTIRRLQRVPFVSLATMGVYFLIMRLTVGNRLEQFVLCGAMGFLALRSDGTRRIYRALLPFMALGICYDLMHLTLPLVESLKLKVHVAEPYLFDRALFGVQGPQGIITPAEYFAVHHWPAVDLITGTAYILFLYWAIGFALYLAILPREPRPQRLLRHYGWTLFFMSLAGFAAYYIYPAAAPWYVSQYGLGPVHYEARFSIAAAARWDQLVGIPYFATFYSRSADVFGAIPSLHVAFPLLVFLYGRALGKRWLDVASLGFSLLMCFSAVYLQHHYLLDVLTGVAYALAAYGIDRLLTAHGRHGRQDAPGREWRHQAMLHYSRHSAQVSRIYFCDNPPADLLFDRKVFPKAKLDLIRKLHALDVRYTAMLPCFIALYLAFGYVVLLVQSLAIQIACYFIIGWIIVGFSTLMHEAVHGLLFESPHLNRWLGFVCGVPLIVSQSAYRSHHLLHHKYEHSEADPDDIETITRRKSIPLTLFYYCYVFIGAYIYLVHIAVRAFQRAEQEKKYAIALEYGIIGALLGFALWLLPMDSFLKTWFFPWLVAAQITSFRGLPEHALTTGGNAFTATRTILSNRFVRFMSCNANYHLDHHLFPGIPWYHLPKVHALLKTEYEQAGSPVFRSYTEFYVDFIKASRAGIIPNVRLIPKRIRDKVCC